jgi:hypothetical protein
VGREVGSIGIDINVLFYYQNCSHLRKNMLLSDQERLFKKIKHQRIIIISNSAFLMQRKYEDYSGALIRPISMQLILRGLG